MEKASAYTLAGADKGVRTTTGSIDTKSGDFFMSTQIDLEIDCMRKSDLKGVIRIERESFASPWTLDSFRWGINSKANVHHYLVGRHSKKPIAYIVFSHLRDEVHILNIAVDKKFRRRGIGSLLLRHTLNLAKSLGAKKATLEVRVSNIAAQSLYRKFGFKVVTIRRKYYSDNREDAYIMWLPNISKCGNIEVEYDDVR